MKRCIKWLCKGILTYLVVILVIASFVLPLSKKPEDRNSSAAGEVTAEGYAGETEAEEEQPDLSDWKNLSDIDLSEALQEQHPRDTWFFLESLTAEEREDLLSRETCLTSPFVQYRFECNPARKKAEHVNGGQIVAVADIRKVEGLFFPSKELSYEAELLKTTEFDTYYEYLNLLAEGEDHATLILNNSGYFTVKRDNDGTIDSVMTVYMQTDCPVQELSYERSHITVLSVLSSNDKLTLGSYPYVENFYREGGWYYTGIHSVWCNDPPHSLYTGYTADHINSCEPTVWDVKGHQKYDFYTDFFTFQVHYRDFGITTGSNAAGGFEWTGPGQHSTCILHYKKCNGTLDVYTKTMSNGTYGNKKKTASFTGPCVIEKTLAECVDVGEGYVIDSYKVEGEHATVSTYTGRITADWDGFDQHDSVTLLLKPNRYYVSFDSNRPKDPMSCYFPSNSEWGRYIHFNAPYGTKAEGDADIDAPLPVPSLRGYRFLGWFTEAAGGEKVTDTTRMRRAESHTLYAHWIDETPPEVDLKVNPTVWTKEDVRLSATAEDEGSGMASLAIVEKSRNGVAHSDIIRAEKYFTEKLDEYSGFRKVNLSLSYDHKKDGIYEYTAKAQDMAGNTSESVLQTVYCDKTAPKITLLVDGEEVENNHTVDWTNRDVTLSVTVKDFCDDGVTCGSGGYKVQLIYEDGTVLAEDIEQRDLSPGTKRELSFTYTLSYPFEGNHTYVIHAEDMVGHTSDYTIRVKLDFTRPELFAGPGMKEAPEGYILQNPATLKDMVDVITVDPLVSEKTGNTVNENSNLLIFRLYGLTYEEIMNGDGGDWSTGDFLRNGHLLGETTGSPWELIYDATVSVEDDISQRFHRFYLAAEDHAGNIAYKRLMLQSAQMDHIRTVIDPSTYE